MGASFSMFVEKTELQQTCSLLSNPGIKASRAHDAGKAPENAGSSVG